MCGDGDKDGRFSKEIQKIIEYACRFKKNIVTLHRLSNERRSGKFQSGQMGQTVNLLSFDFGGSNPSLPTK